MSEMNVLKLDSSYKPIEVITWQDAFILTWLKKAYVVEYTEQWAHSATQKFQIPAVIALIRFVDEKIFTVPCTTKNVMLRDGHLCQYCGKSSKQAQLNIDHVIPRSKGGKTCWENVVTACTACNQAKKDLFLHETGLKLAQIPKKPSYRALIGKKIGSINDSWIRYL